MTSEYGRFGASGIAEPTAIKFHTHAAILRKKYCIR
jgi:hypothetical protein